MTIGNEFDAWAMSHYQGTCGIYSCERLDLFAGLWDDNGTLKALAAAASGSVGFKYVTGGTNATDKILALVFGATAGATQAWVKDYSLPPTWKKDGGIAGNRSKIVVAAKVRKLDTTGSAAENGDLELNLQSSWHNDAFDSADGTQDDGDTAISNLGTLASPVPVKGTTLEGATVLPSKAVAASEEAFRWVFFDITSGMTANQIAALRPGATMTLKLCPNKAVGANLNVEVTDIRVLCLEHLVPEDRFEKCRPAA